MFLESINSTTNDYSYLFEELISSDVKNIRKAVILEHQGMKLERAQNIANEIASSFNSGGYGFDNSIPENSTFSLHV